MSVTESDSTKSVLDKFLDNGSKVEVLSSVRVIVKGVSRTILLIRIVRPNLGDIKEFCLRSIRLATRRDLRKEWLGCGVGRLDCWFHRSKYQYGRRLTNGNTVDKVTTVSVNGRESSTKEVQEGPSRI